MRFLSLLLLTITFLGCKEAAPEKKFISAPSLIEQQVRHIDTSLYSIKKYSSTDTLESDTLFIPRENFRKEVYAFLSIPDLSNPKKARSFNEESRYDELLKRVIISYTPVDALNEPYQRIELFVEPNMAAGDQVKTILTTRRQGDRNGFEQEELIWQMDRSCTRILTTRQPGGAEQLRTEKWSWNE